MRYAPFLVAGDRTLKSHRPALTYIGGGGGLHGYSGLRPMSPEREAQVQREIQQTKERRRGA